MDMKVDTKRKQVYLTNSQKYEIASFCIENRNVIQDIDPRIEIEKDKFYPYTIWRVKQSHTAKEFNDKMGAMWPTISTHHIVASIEFFNEICELTGRLPEPKAVQETVEMDMLKIENVKLSNLVAVQNKQAEENAKLTVALTEKISKYQEALHRITQCIPAEVFGLKKK